MKTKIKNYIIKYKKLLLLDMLKNKRISPFIKWESLVNDLKKANCFGEIFSIIYSNDKHYFYYYCSKSNSYEIISFFNLLKDKITKIISENFIYFYNGLFEDSKQKINTLIYNELNFEDYINFSDLYNSLNLDYKSLNKSFEFISIFELISNKINDEKFLDNLEENFGVYLEVENFIDELKNKGEMLIKDKYSILEKYEIFLIFELNSLLSCNQLNFNNFIENSYLKNIYKENMNKELNLFKMREKYIHDIKNIKNKIKFGDKEKTKKK